jgi:uncharacterized membrane protein
MATTSLTRDARTTLLLKKQRSKEAPHQHAVNIVHHDEASFGERLADRIASGIGSWTFLIVQSAVVAIWVAYNLYFAARWFRHQPFDPYPLILLNLMFSVQAAYTGPVLLLAGNRQAQKDRLTLEHAADESEEAERRTLTILAEIQNNTELTLKILKHVERSQQTIADSHQRIAVAHERLAAREDQAAG